MAHAPYPLTLADVVRAMNVNTWARRCPMDPDEAADFYARMQAEVQRIQLSNDYSECARKLALARLEMLSIEVAKVTRERTDATVGTVHNA